MILALDFSSREKVGGGWSSFKKPIWSKSSNDVVEAVNRVMCAVSWSPLGDSTN